MPKISQYRAIKPKNKYHAKKIQADGITFDSRVEYMYYIRFIKNRYISFDDHKSFEITPRFKLNGKTHRKRVYSPDFIEYDTHGQMIKVVDVKGGKVTADASLRINEFEYLYQVPVVLARYNYRTKQFQEKVK
ncbi:DUF1064 domain-containing protein [Fructilactobacillus fructivorans]|nr:DUF1064 domain-containing protein [Fructilactobacillus fructivorans]KRK58490.1 hypothetical protein FC73_GL000042 [Fructilactobacillus fructivorans]